MINMIALTQYINSVYYDILVFY